MNITCLSINTIFTAYLTLILQQLLEIAAFVQQIPPSQQVLHRPRNKNSNCGNDVERRYSWCCVRDTMTKKKTKPQWRKEMILWYASKGNEDELIVSSRTDVETKATSSQQQQPNKHMFLLSLKWSELDQSIICNTKNIMKGDNNHYSTNSNSNTAATQHQPSQLARQQRVLPFSKIVSDIWKWKDSVLGDGRDFFIPKPNTLRALQQYIMQYVNKNNSHTMVTNQQQQQPYTITECVILSNCARFEILLVVGDNINSNDDDDGDDDDRNSKHNDKSKTNCLRLQDQVVSDISFLLYAQVQSYLTTNTNDSNLLKAASSFLDWPDVIDTTAMVQWQQSQQPDRNKNDSSTNVQQQQQQQQHHRNINDIRNHWNVVYGVHDIIHHLCRISVGIAPRPRRPDRPVEFRPFSSRDAHILMQFKRTMDIITTIATTTTTKTKSSNNILLILLQYAIRAGKAARNPQRVPMLVMLRKQYGETGNSNKYDVVPPSHVMESVRQSVYELVIHPMVQECNAYLFRFMMGSTCAVTTTTMNNDTATIHTVRHRAIAMANTIKERQYILKQLHQPTIYLRQQQHAPQNDALYDTTLCGTKSMVWNETTFWNDLSSNLTILRQTK